MLPALLRVRPQPGALPEAKRQELQQTLPLLPQAPVPVMGAGMRGRSARARVLYPHRPASPSSCVPARMDRVSAAVNLINVKINNVL